MSRYYLASHRYLIIWKTCLTLFNYAFLQAYHILPNYNNHSLKIKPGSNFSAKYFLKFREIENLIPFLYLYCNRIRSSTLCLCSHLSTILYVCRTYCSSYYNTQQLKSVESTPTITYVHPYHTKLQNFCVQKQYFLEQTFYVYKFKASDCKNPYYKSIQFFPTCKYQVEIY